MNQLSNKVTASNLIKVLAANHFKVFVDSSKNFNLNIVNIRSNNKEAGKFDDTQVVFWFYNKVLNKMIFDVTVDPGIPYLLKPIMPKGTAIVVPGQYINVWQLGKHKGKYDALVQINNITIVRDNNKDMLLDINSDFRDTGLFGINCHRASSFGIEEFVGVYSAGCVVHKDPVQYNKLIKVCKESAINWSNIFTATWISESDYDKIIT